MPVKTGQFEGRKGDEIFSSTHLIEEEKPICGAKINPSYDLAIVSHGANLDYVSCKRCMRVWKSRKG